MLKNKMEKIKITQIQRSWNDRVGKPYIGRNGKPFERVAIQAEEYQNRYLSGFGNQENSQWKVGDVVEIIKDEVNKDGKTYLNFKTPDKIDLLEARIEKLERQFNQRPDEPKERGGHAEELPEINVDEDIDPSELPF